MTTPWIDDTRLASAIDEIVHRIVAAGAPTKVVLFGSWARGDARPRSDLDILVVEDRSEAPRYERSARYRLALRDVLPDRDIDIVVWTPEEIAEWASVPQAFISTVLREGKVLYENAR
jgi:predicted nucleotidyltransferase